jgi:hypothetical protein
MQYLLSLNQFLLDWCIGLVVFGADWGCDVMHMNVEHTSPLIVNDL